MKYEAYESSLGWAVRDVGLFLKQADARRIAALLNAADGVDTATIEALGPGGLGRMRDGIAPFARFAAAYLARMEAEGDAMRSSRIVYQLNDVTLTVGDFRALSDS